MFCPFRKANPYRRMAKAMKTGRVSDNLLHREFEAHGPRCVLLTDITYIPLNDGFCYLSTILDAFTKQILSYVLSESLEVDFVIETVEQLIEKHFFFSDVQLHFYNRPTIIFVLDLGSSLIVISQLVQKADGLLKEKPPVQIE